MEISSWFIRPHPRPQCHIYQYLSIILRGRGKSRIDPGSEDDTSSVGIWLNDIVCSTCVTPCEGPKSWDHGTIWEIMSMGNDLRLVCYDLVSW